MIRLTFLKSNLFSSSVIYTLTNFFNAGLPFFLLPVLTKHLTTDEYGIAALFTVLSGFITPLIGLGVSGAIARAYFRNEITDFKAYVSNCLFICLVTAIFFFLVLFLAGDSIARFCVFPKEWLFAILVTGVGTFIFEAHLSIYRVQHKATLYCVFKVLQTIANFALVYYFVVCKEKTWDGFILGKIISLSLFALISFSYLYYYKYIKLKLNKEYLKHALAFGVPLIPHLLSGFVMTFSDRLFLAKYSGLGVTGSYSVAYQIGSVISILVTSFNTAWSPWLYNELKSDSVHTQHKLVKMNYYYAVGLLLLTLLFLLVTPLIIKFVKNDNFEISYSVIIWVAIAYYFQGCYMMAVNYLFYFGKTLSIAIATFGVAILNLVLNYFLISKYNDLGAAMSTTISFVVKFIWTLIICQLIYPLPWFTKQIKRAI